MKMPSVASNRPGREPVQYPALGLVTNICEKRFSGTNPVVPVPLVPSRAAGLWRGLGAAACPQRPLPAVGNGPARAGESTCRCAVALRARGALRAGAARGPTPRSRDSPGAAARPEEGAAQSGRRTPFRPVRLAGGLGRCRV